MKIFPIPALFFGLLAVYGAPAHGAIVTLTFTGTYTFPFGPLFGDPEGKFPYSYEITFDTSRNTSKGYFPPGALIRPPQFTQLTNNEWHGYSASTIVGSNLTFGGESWTAADLADPGLGSDADFWFDTDIKIATPTRSSMVFSSVMEGTLRLGGSAVNSENFLMLTSSDVMPRYPERGRAHSGNMLIKSIPEPTTLLLAASGLAVMIGRRARGG